MRGREGQPTCTWCVGAVYGASAFLLKLSHTDTPHNLSHVTRQGHRAWTSAYPCPLAATHTYTTKRMAVTGGLPVRGVQGRSVVLQA